ncbi:MAG TPA: hypothetical protein PLH94_09000 [Fimbriimonadaceae bacterium]|nr:hypothetical protein [Fimbriimonadaceae bacterium]
MRTRSLVGATLALFVSVALAAPAWQRVQIGGSNLSIELPLAPKAIEIPLTDAVRKQYSTMKTYQVISGQSAVVMTYSVLKATKKVDIDGAANGAMNSMKSRPGVNGWKGNISKTTIQNRPARRMSASFDAGGMSLKVEGMVVSDGAKMWQVITTYTPSDKAGADLSKRVLNSLKF